MRPSLAALLLAVVILQTAPAAAQLILPAPTDRVVTDRASSEDEPPVSLDRIRRALDRPVNPSHPHLLDLTEYVFVVADAPELPLFDDADVRGAVPFVGAPTHADMVAVARPSRLDQAVGSDVLGVVTSALFMLAPRAIQAVAGWFSGGEDERAPGWAGYTATYVLAPRTAASPTAHTLVFHRLEGQRVAFSTSASHPPNASVVIAVDGQEWDLLEQETTDRTIPNELLLPKRVANLHTLTVSHVPGTVLEHALTIKLLVVVHERMEP